MSACIITIKNSNWMKREVILYQPTDGQPNSVILPLTDSLREIYQEFQEHGDADWFLDPGKLAGLLVARSVPVMTDEMRTLIKSLPTASRSKLESDFFLGMPSLFPDAVKLSGCSYEYSITLSEEVEDSVTVFLGYSIEVYKLQNNRRLSTIMTNQNNFIKREQSVHSE